jgi:hypothetical protein
MRQLLLYANCELQTKNPAWNPRFRIVKSTPIYRKADGSQFAAAAQS